VPNKKPTRQRDIPRSPSRVSELRPDEHASFAGAQPEARPEEKFLDRMKGTLPELITVGDLETLNAGLRFFFTDLRRAWELFQQSEGHGRAGAVKALGAMWRLIALFKQPFDESLYVPILRVQDALRALDGNTVSPMLRRVRRSGRAGSTSVRAALRGYAAGTVERLVQAEVPLPQARAQVASALVKLGARPERGSKQVTATTVRHWCDEVAADVGRHGDAAIVYHSMFTDDERGRFSRQPSDQARRSLALKSLAQWVMAVLPELQKPS
jgi:hypothetical protein